MATVTEQHGEARAESGQNRAGSQAPHSESPARSGLMTDMRIALFDLDGTLTRHDSLFPYVLGFCLRHPLRLPRLLSMPWHALRYLFAGRDRGALKEALI